MADGDQSDANKKTPQILSLVPISPNVDILSFKTFLEDKVKKYSCSLCGEDHYAILQYFDPNIPSVLNLITSNVSEKTFGVSYIAYGIACTNCGNISLFQTIVVDNWVKERIQGGHKNE